MQINDNEIDWNHVIEAWVTKFAFFWYTYCQNCQLGFSSKIKVSQLGSTRLGTFTARARSSRKIPARTHHYHVPNRNWYFTKYVHTGCFLSDQLNRFSIIPINWDIFYSQLISLLCQSMMCTSKKILCTVQWNQLFIN